MKQDDLVVNPDAKADIGIVNAYDDPIYTNKYVMCCYFNIGIEAQVGINVEKRRSRCRAITKFYYFIFTAYEGLINWRKNQVKSYVNRVVSRPKSDKSRVVADMEYVQGSPYNLCGTNITSLYGGWVTRD